MTNEIEPVNWEETWAGQVIKHAKDLRSHPTKRELGWSVFRPDIMSDMEPTMARIIMMHPEFCEDCRNALNSIKDEVAKRGQEFNVKTTGSDDLL